MPTFEAPSQRVCTNKAEPLRGYRTSASKKNYIFSALYVLVVLYVGVCLNNAGMSRCNPTAQQSLNVS